MTLTPEQRAAGWREHDGGISPLPLYANCSVLYRNGHQGSAHHGFWIWDDRVPGGSDIIAYLPEDTSHDQ